MLRQKLSIQKKKRKIPYLGLIILLVFFIIYTLSSFIYKPGFTAGVNKIVSENRQAGSARWQSSSIKASPATESRAQAATTTWTDNTISGYAGSTSINVGSSIKLYVRTSQPGYNMEVYRMGWYGGTGARLIQTISGLKGINQPIPQPQSGTGLIEAAWQATYTLQTSSSWVSGVYLVKLIATDGTVAYIIFVVRDDSAQSDIVYQIPVNTYQAYNAWGGKSLYDYNSTGGRAYKVSYDRPYADDGTGLFFLGDYNMIRWLESKGYNITYATSVDTQSNPNLLNGHKTFLSNFHDEYWSKPMRDNLTSALNQGKNLAFFSANNIYWQVRFESSSNGVANRVLTCYKDITLDPFANTNPSLTTINWRDAPVNQPENALLGVMYESQLGGGVAYPWVVQNATNWVYNGTGLKDGDSITGMVGYEYDKIWNNGLTPAGLVSLSNSPVVDAYGTSSFANGSVYQAASKGFVFTAGTIYWSWKIDDNSYQHHGSDYRVQQMTANVLDTMNSGVIPPPAPSPTPVPPNPGGNYTLYGDSLADGWQNWSWGGTVNLADTSHPYGGTHDIAWTPQAYGGLSLNNSAGFNTAGFVNLKFAVQASQTNQSASVNVVDASGYTLISLPLTSYGGNPVVGSYKVYSIPLIDLGAFNKTITGVQFTNQTSAAQPTLYVGGIIFEVGGSATATPTSVPTATPTVGSTPTPTGGGYVVYGDNLNANWQDWSWGSTLNFADTSHPYGGNHNIAWTPNQAYAGLYLSNPNGVSTSGYTTLTFAVQASQANESASIALVDTSYTVLLTLPLANYGGDPVQGAYKKYTVPLADLSAVNQTITGIQLTNQTSNPQPVMYVAAIALN